jgi:hypothetical protein
MGDITVYTLLAVAFGLYVILRAKSYYTAAASAARERNDALVRQLNRALHAKEAREASEEEILAVRSELVRTRARGRQLAEECSRLRRASIELEAVAEAQLSNGALRSAPTRSAPPHTADAAHAAARIELPALAAPRGDKAQRTKRRLAVEATGGSAAALPPAAPTDAGTQRGAEAGAKGAAHAASASVLVLPPHGAAKARSVAGQPTLALRAAATAAPHAPVVPRAALVAEPATLRSALRLPKRGGVIPPPPLNSPPPLPPPGSPRGAAHRASVPLPSARSCAAGAAPKAALADGGGGSSIARRAAPSARVEETASSQRKRRPLVWEESGTAIATKETESLSVGVPKAWGCSHLYALEVSGGAPAAVAPFRSPLRTRTTTANAAHPRPPPPAPPVLFGATQWSFEADGDLIFGVRIFDGGAGDSALRAKAMQGECSFMYRYILRESCSQFDSLPLTYLTKGVEATYAVEPLTLRSQAQRTLLPGNRQAVLEWTNDPGGWAQLWSPSRRIVRLRYTVTLKPVAT